MTSSTTLSTVDFSRLVPLVGAAASRVTEAVVEQLDEKLASATLVPPQAMRPDIVTMNSKVLLSCAVWETPREYRLVYPPERTCERGELCVLSVLGTELLGARIGARFALGSGPGFRFMELVALPYQPEAAGDWDRSLAAARHAANEPARSRLNPRTPGVSGSSLETAKSRIT